MKNVVSENISDFLNRFEDEPISDIPDSEVEGLEDIEAAEFPEDEIEVENSTDQMINAFRTRILIPEFNRKNYLLKFKDGREIEGTPMAELSSGDFLFKVEGQLKKIKLSDISNFNDLEEEPEEEISEDFSEARFVRESIDDEDEEEDLGYMYDEEEGCPYCGNRHCEGNCEDEEDE
jgi:hypothetical protein